MFKKTKKLVSVVVTGMMLATLTTGCLSSTSSSSATPAKTTPTAASGSAKVIKVSIGLNEQSPLYAGMKKFGDIVKEKTSGRYEVQLYPNAQLGDDLKATEALRMGTLEMTPPSTSPLTGIDPKLMIFDLPFLFPNKQVADKVLDGPIGQDILEGLTSKGLKGLGFMENGYRQLTNSVREVKSPADLKGLKIRTMENPMHLAAWKAMGANPTPMPFSEVFTAMQQKTIDGQENPITTIYLQKFQEVQKYTTLTGHIYTPFIVLMSKKTWDSLSADDQKIFLNAVNEAKVFQRQTGRDAEAGQIKKLREAGMTVTELTPDQLKAFQDATKSVYDQFADKIGKDFLAKVQTEIAKDSK
ncbi:MAG: TRAP transporter substrate-binding protein [Desulfitobacteriaceae bacterium]|nr:TRAP transporter substrate-binding protein [Desulfitobacteriaceae bacterium]MDI6877848.1 TRAP transporter substrate-binding protein [Desulfitobacteriaceae bacterium]MDI6912751.1 TRAP transporter substrate-binding protein [Desulfitobacteriaceae bacterium]